MKRILRKRWDEINGQLLVNYFRVYGDTLQVTLFKSPIFLRNPEDAKGRMSSNGKSSWYSKYQIEQLLSVFEEVEGKYNIGEYK